MRAGRPSPSPSTRTASAPDRAARCPASISAGWCATAADARADRQGRRPCDGGGHHRRARRSSARCAPSSRSAPRPKSSGCRTRRCLDDRRRARRPKARRWRCSTRWRRPGHSAPGMPRRCFVLPRHRLVDARPVGSGHIRADLRSASGGRIQAIAFRAADTALGDFLFKQPRRDGSRRRLAVGQLLERQPHGGIPHHRRGAGLIRFRPRSTVCSRFRSPIWALVVS